MIHDGETQTGDEIGKTQQRWDGLRGKGNKKKREGNPILSMLDHAACGWSSELWSEQTLELGRPKKGERPACDPLCALLLLSRL